MGEDPAEGLVLRLLLEGALSLGRLVFSISMLTCMKWTELTMDRLKSSCMALQISLDMRQAKSLSSMQGVCP